MPPPTSIPRGSIFIGLDPGSVNMGLAILSRAGATLFQVKLPSGETDAMYRIDLVQRVVVELIQPHLFKATPVAAVVEQAAYAALYGQTTLAEARTAGAIALRQAGVPLIQLLTPYTIRKLVHGDNRARSQELWPDVPPDAGSALACALCAWIDYGKQDAD